MKLGVLGASGRTGSQLVTQALDAGHEIKVLARNPEKLAGWRSQVTVVQGNVTDASAVESLLEGCDAVLSALGHVGDSPRDVLSVAANHIIAGMRRHGIRRLVVLASTAVPDPADHLTLGQRVVERIAEYVMGSLAHDDPAAAQIIASSELDWTIVRAVILTNGPRTRSFKVGSFGRGTGIRVSRADVADFMLACAVEGQHIRGRPVISD